MNSKKKFLDYFINHGYEYKTQFDFSTLEEYQQYLMQTESKSLKGEIMKSFEEIEIANFLYINGIEYEYESQYKLLNVNYKPDFYLPKEDIYLEHFGINRNGEVPSFFESQNPNLTASESYNQGIVWKRNTHKQHNTKLLETYSYEKFEGNLLSNLKDKLLSENIVFHTKNSAILFNEIKASKNERFQNTVKIITNFLEYMKSNNIDFEQIESKITDLPLSKRIRTNKFIDVIKPIMNDYSTVLKKEESIDFADMINIANGYVKTNQYVSKYKYIIIDEFQDISKNRLDLIQSLRQQNNSKLFVVGDDWQSIYGFTGSNVELFTNFDKYVGFTDISKIETTYRYPQQVVNISSSFIQKNKLQVQKNVTSLNKNQNNDAVNFLIGENIYELKNKLSNLIRELPQNSTVLLLGRYSFDIDFFLDGNLFRKGERIILKNRNDLLIKFLTVHGSKGLEADYVIVLNNNQGVVGFPSNISDDPIFNILKEKDNSYPHSEERRLFYVALTRTKKSVWLLIDKNKKSPFIIELEYDYPELLKNEQKNPPCQKCGKTTILKNGKYGLFFSCVSYPSCKGTLSYNKK